MQPVLSTTLRLLPGRRHALLRPARSPDSPAHSPRVLLLTSGLGYGHVRAAQAVEAVLLQRLVEVEIRDLWSLMNPGAASIVHQTYLRLVQEYPDLYERIYQLDERTWRQILQSETGPPTAVLEVLEMISQIAASTAAETKGVQYVSDRLLLSMLYTSLPYDSASLAGNGVRARLAIMKWSWMRLSKRLASIVAAYQPDVVISTQMIPAAMISALKQRGRLSVPQVGVLTDYGLHDFWRQPGMDYYCIVHPSVVTSKDAHEMSAQMVATGAPLMPGFARPLSQAQARQQLGIATDGKVVLVLGGGLGLSVDVIATRLLEQPMNCTLIVMLGKNSAARSTLSARVMAHSQLLREHDRGRVRVHEWTDRMDMFIRAADVVVGKPGGISVAEILACGRPLFATRSLGGQEGFNVRFLERHGVGALVADVELAGRIEAILSQPAALAEMQQRAWSLGYRDGAQRVAELALDLARAHCPRPAVGEH